MVPDGLGGGLGQEHGEEKGMRSECRDPTPHNQKEQLVWVSL